MVINYKPHEPVKQRAALLLRQAVDALHVVADGEDALPAGDGVGADDGVRGGKVGADVLRGAAGFRVELEAVVGRGGVEEWLGVGGGEGLEEALVGGGEAVVELVA